MTDLRARVAYLRGLCDGLEVDDGSREGKVLTSIIGVLGDLTEELNAVAQAQDELADELDEVDDELYAISGDDQYLQVPVEVTDDVADDEADEEEEDAVVLFSCPNCGLTLGLQAGDMDDTGIDVTCPNCGSVVIDPDENTVESAVRGPC